MEKEGDDNTNQGEESALTWEQLVVAEVDGNANKWFETYGPVSIFTQFDSRLREIESLKFLAFAAREDSNIIPAFDLDNVDIGESIDPNQTNLGREVLGLLRSMGVKMDSEASSGMDTTRDFQPVSYTRISGEWATSKGTPFKQNFETYVDGSGNVTGLWFVDLIVSPVPIEPYNHFEIEDDSGVQRLTVSEQALAKGSFTVGELCARVQIPHFIKNLAYICETPLPGSQFMTLSRDLAYGEIPESARPVPFFVHRKNSSLQAFSRTATDRNRGEIQYVSDEYSDVIKFGWRFTSETMANADKVLSVMVNGCTEAMNIVQDGFENYRSLDYPAPWDDVVGSPCKLLASYKGIGSRKGAPQWIPNTAIGDIALRSKWTYQDLRSLIYEGDWEEARNDLETFISDGAGSSLSTAINDMVFGFLLPELADDEDVFESTQDLATTAINMRVGKQTVNATFNLGTANYLIGDYQEATSLLSEARDAEDGSNKAEALYVLGLIERAEGNHEKASILFYESDKAGGFNAPDWLEDFSLRKESQNLVLSWFTKQEGWDYNENANPPSLFFGFSKFYSTVGENQTSVQRPAYVSFHETTVFVNAPFSPIQDFKSLDKESEPWAVGKMHNSYTYRLGIDHETIVDRPDYSLGLVRKVLDLAAKRDYELTGEIAFQVDKNTEETRSEDVEPEVKPEIPADPRFAEFTWEDHVRKAVSGSTLNHEELAKCLVSIARNIFEPPALLGRDGELASRVIWRFSSGFILWYAAPSDYLILSHEDDELYQELIWQTIGEGDIASADFTWNRDSNGWIYSGELQVWELVSELSLTHDEVAIFLPWDSEFPTQSFDYISDVETMRDAFEIYPEDGEEPRDYEGLFSFFQLLKNETIALPGEIHSIQLAEGKELMPRYSAFGRFHRMLKDLEESFQWLVMLDWDPRAEQDDEELEDFDPSNTNHIFIEDTIQGVWFTTGSIEFVHDRNNGDILELTEAAERNGLQLIVNGVEDKDSDLVTIVGPGHKSHVRGSDFSTMVTILSEIWAQKEKYPELEEVIGYADLAFPLSDLISRGVVREKDGAREMIRDAFGVLLEALDMDDVGIRSIQDLGLR